MHADVFIILVSKLGKGNIGFPVPQFNGTGSVPVTVREQTALLAAIASTTPALINSQVGSCPTATGTAALVCRLWVSRRTGDEIVGDSLHGIPAQPSG